MTENTGGSETDNRTATELAAAGTEHLPEDFCTGNTPRHHYLICANCFIFRLKTSRTTQQRQKDSK